MADETNNKGEITDDAAVMTNPIHNGEADAPDGIGMTTDDHAPMMPTGSHGGGMGSGSGLDTDDLKDTTDGKPLMTNSEQTDGAGTGNFGDTPAGSDDEQTGVAGEVDGVRAAGGI